MTHFSMMKGCVAAILVAIGALFAACGDDDPITPSDGDWGVSDYSLQMRVVNEDGLNLLDSKVLGNIVRDSVTAEYAGQVYRLDTIASTKPHPDTPDAGVSFTGLTRYAPVDTKNYLMLFGDFDGKTSVKDRELVINWNDGGKKDTVTFSYTCERKDGKVVTRTDVQLNHKDTTLPVTFVR